MDADWFKKKQRQAGVTSSDLGARINRDRTVVSRIYHGRQRMTLDQAHAFAEMLHVPVAEVLVRAGITDAKTATELTPGFSDSDAKPFQHKQPDDTDAPSPDAQIAQALGSRPGIDIWQAATDAGNLAGLLIGDIFLLDTNSRNDAGENDLVLAQVYDWNAGTARTILRRFDPPVLAPVSTNPAHQSAHIVDRNSINIMGRIIASWRRE